MTLTAGTGCCAGNDSEGGAGNDGKVGAGNDGNAGADSGKKKAGLSLSTVTVTGFPRFRSTNVLVVRLRTWKGPS